LELPPQSPSSIFRAARRRKAAQSRLAQAEVLYQYLLSVLSVRFPIRCISNAKSINVTYYNATCTYGYSSLYFAFPIKRSKAGKGAHSGAVAVEGTAGTWSRLWALLEAEPEIDAAIASDEDVAGTMRITNPGGARGGEVGDA
jgi:hypothetical protein